MTLKTTMNDTDIFEINNFCDGKRSVSDTFEFLRRLRVKTI